MKKYKIEILPFRILLLIFIILISWNIYSHAQGVGDPEILVFPDSLDFGSIPIGDTEDKDLTITNVGSDTLEVTNIITFDEVFNVSDTSFILIPDEDINITVSFTPSESILYSDSLTVVSNASNGDQTIALLGQGIETVIDLDPSTEIDFESIPIGDTEDKDLTITNVGTDTLEVTNIITFDEVFSVSDTSFILIPDEDIIITVSFTPLESILYSDSLTVVSNASNGDQTIALLGQGIEAAIVLDPSTEINFGVIPVGDTEERELTITNVGSDTLEVTNIMTTNEAFIISATSFILIPGLDTVITVFFTPSDTIAYTDSLTVESNASNGDQTIALLGQGIEAAIVLDPSTEIDFGTIPIGDTEEKDLTITNVGSDTLEVTNIITFDEVFNVSDTSFILIPDEDIIITVSFTPSESILYSDSLTVISNASNGDQTIALLGEGIDTSIVGLIISDTELFFDRVIIGQLKEKKVTLKNSGSQLLLVTSIIISGDSSFSTNVDSFNIEPSDSLIIPITFQPKDSVHYFNSLKIVSNAVNSDSIIYLNGEGFHYPSSINLSVNKPFGNNDITKTENYRLIGLPGRAEIPISATVSGVYGEDWKVFYDNGGDIYIGSNDFTYSLGIGYWILSKSNLVIDSLEVVVVELDENNYASIPLLNLIDTNNDAGWNIITNPFNKKIKWNNIKTLNNIDPNIDLWGYTGNGPYNGYDKADTMYPYKAYYITNLSNQDSLKIPYFNLDGNSNTPAIPDLIVPKSLSVLMEYSKKDISELKIGFDAGAIEGYDTLDKYAPPSTFNSFALTLVNKNLTSQYQYLIQDYRPEPIDGEIFDLLVKGKTGSNIILTFEGLNNFEEYEIVLEDNRLHKIYDLKESSVVNLNLLHRSNEFSLLIGNSEFIIENLKSDIPQEFILYQNYPNPFNPNTVIRFALPITTKVSVSIYNILGELVENLLDNQNMEQGYHEIGFDGSKLSSGVYIYGITTEGFTRVKKMILIK